MGDIFQDHLGTFLRDYNNHFRSSILRKWVKSLREYLSKRTYLNRVSVGKLDRKTQQEYACVWNEMNVGLTANIFASMRIQFSTTEVCSEEKETTTIHLDGCTAWIKDAVLSIATLNFCILRQCLIIHTYCILSHIQIEFEVENTYLIAPTQLRLGLYSMKTYNFK